MKTNSENLTTVLVTDCGSTTTKALLFEKQNGAWTQTFRGEAPTTVEEPVADVTVGALNAFTEIEEISGRGILGKDENHSQKHPFYESEKNPGQGIDLYLSTSSAGGGLQMLVTGVVRQMTAESAERAALGAGAIVMDVLSVDDRREDYERIKRIRHLKPDIVLLTGGVDGGAKAHVIEIAEIILAASPKPRFGDTLKLPVIYAGNKDSAQEVEDILSSIAQVLVVDNVRPVLEEENLKPAREAIHEFFLKHVMSHSPGYGKLLNWTPVPIMPTPAAVGDMVYNYASKNKLQVLAVDIGGATTDVFSVFKNLESEFVFHRTVSANLGMSYSIANVLVETGIENIARWLPFEASFSDLRDRLRNKMIRPTSIPQTKEDLRLEEAVCREALRLSLKHHRELAVGLGGVRQERGIADIFSQKKSRYELVDLMQLDLVIGSGGVLSHAPHRLGAALMMLDGFGLQGITEIAVDSIFMLPHLGVFSSVHPQAAEEIFIKDCLVSICHSIVPVWDNKKGRGGDVVAEVVVNDKAVAKIRVGELQVVPLKEGEEVELKVVPALNYVDVGCGKGQVNNKVVKLGAHGLLLDGRNRPMEMGEEKRERRRRQEEAYGELGVG